MHVVRIKLSNFMSHDNTEVTLPLGGIVLVTGNNGSGKSALMEGVAMATYGKTLRGTSPFREEGEGFAQIDFDFAEEEYTSKLKWTGKTKQHKWAGGEGDTAYETNTKSLDALAAAVGSFDIWRRTHVFSSSDASSFTQATDAQRKQLLESLLGIDWFDVALKQARGELKVTKPRVERLQKEMVTLLADIAKHQEDYTKHKAEFADLTLPPTDEDLKTRKTTLAGLVRGAADEMDQAHAKVHRLQTAGEVEAREAMNLKRKAKEMPDSCFTCGQDIPADKKIAVMQAATKKLKEAKIKRADGQKELREFQDEVVDLKADLDALQTKLQAVDLQESTATLARGHYTYVKSALTTATNRAKELGTRAHTLEDEVGDAQVDLAELEACTKILGFTGVRAQVLGSALSGIEQMANFWLSRLVGDGISIKLASYKDKKSGKGTTDAISLEVIGAGGGHGYDGASGGERRRIDVAILFALAEVAANAHGTEGTLFFDEVFDALDQEGMAAVTDALQEISRKRAVVVITHTHVADLAQVASKHIHVEEGETMRAGRSAWEMAQDSEE